MTARTDGDYYLVQGSEERKVLIHDVRALSPNGAPYTLIAYSFFAESAQVKVVEIPQDGVNHRGQSIIFKPHKL
jgi:hypothetical protein